MDNAVESMLKSGVDNTHTQISKFRRYLPQVIHFAIVNKMGFKVVDFF